MAPQSPGLLTITMAAMVAPRNTSREMSRVPAGLDSPGSRGSRAGARRDWLVSVAMLAFTIPL